MPQVIDTVTYVMFGGFLVVDSNGNPAENLTGGVVTLPGSETPLTVLDVVTLAPLTTISTGPLGLVSAHLVPVPVGQAYVVTVDFPGDDIPPQEWYGHPSEYGFVTLQADEIQAALETAQAAQEAAAAASKASSTTRWLFEGPNLVDGKTGDWLRLHSAAKIDGVTVFLDGAPSVDTTIDLEYAPGLPDTGTVQNLYGVTPKGTLAAGKTWGDINLPPTAELLAGQLRPRLVDAPPAPSGSGTAATVESLTTYNSGTAASSSHAIPKPTGGQAGDYIWVVTSATNSTAQLPAGYSQVFEQLSDPATPNNRMTHWVAPWSAGLVAPTATMTGGACPMAAVAFLIRGADSANSVMDTATRGQNAAGASFTTQALTTTAATDLVLEFFGTRFGANIDNYLVTATGGPAGLTEISKQVTTRAAAANVGLYVGKASGAIASGAALATATGTAAGGTGSLTNTAWTAATVTVKRGAGTAGANRLEIEVSFR